MAGNTNISMLNTIALGLGELAEEVVFVGGAITGLYIEDRSQISEVRQTDDVDCIIEISSRIAYALLEDRLRKKKFENDQRVICRWHYKGIIVDIMPTDPAIPGFSNRWYKEGIEHAVFFQTTNNVVIKILALPYFVGCKLEVLFNRGGR